MSDIRNLRDVGKGINEITGKALLKEKQLYRSGAIDDWRTNSLPIVSTVISLRNAADPEIKSVLQLKVAPKDSMNNYVTEADVFKERISRFFRVIADDCIWPVLVHCNAGKDRTGVAIALLLRSIDISREAIVQEYLRSEGNLYPDSIIRLLQDAEVTDHLKMNYAQSKRLKSIIYT